MMMLPALILPFHDPTGSLLAHLETITPQLKIIFGRVFISVSPATKTKQARQLNYLSQDNFFALNFNAPDTLPGEHYLSGYRHAVTICPSEQILHLCDIDKVAFALQSDHEASFVADINSINRDITPLLFQRSPAAWATYPRNYREFEHFAITVGQILFGRYLDFAWSHLTLQAGQLKKILPQLKQRDFSVLAEIVLLLEDQLTTKEVDWLAWEDPFIDGRDPAQLRLERENSRQETHKRLNGMMPFLQLLLESINLEN